MQMGHRKPKGSHRRLRDKSWSLQEKPALWTSKRDEGQALDVQDVSKEAFIE